MATRCWSDLSTCSGSEAKYGSVALSGDDSSDTAGSGTPSTVGEHDGWLDSGTGAGLAGSSSTYLTVKGNPKKVSTHTAKLPRGTSTGRHAFSRSLSHKNAKWVVGKACHIQKVPCVVLEEAIPLLQQGGVGRLVSPYPIIILRVLCSVMGY